MAAPHAIRAVLFDAAGTLIELREPAGETYARVALSFGVEIPAWRLQDALGRILQRAPAMVFSEAPVEEIPGLERSWWRDVVRSTFRAADSESRFEDFDAFFDALYAVFSDPGIWTCRTGCLDALAAVRAAGAATAVVSNFDRRLPGLLAGLGVAPLLDAIVLASDAGAAKPDPAIFQLALDRLQVPATESVFVGDCSHRDIAGARALGMRAIDVASLATLAELPAHMGALQPDQEIRNE